MVIKICFNNEIHRCSKPPVDYTSLLQLVQATFKSGLPKNFKLHYVIQGIEQNVPLDSQEAYDGLLKADNSSTIKVFVTEVEEEKEQEAAQPIQKLAYFSYMPGNDEQIKKEIKKVLEEQMSTIVSLAKDMVLQELRPLMEEEFAKAKINNNIPIEASKEVEGEKPEENLNDEVPKEVKQEEKDETGKKGKKGKGFIKKIGEALDVWSHKFEEDPYVEVEEGKYPQSVVEKADKLKEVFVEESRKNLLEFAKRYDRRVTVAQLAHVYMVKEDLLQQEPDIVEDQGQEKKEEEGQQD